MRVLLWCFAVVMMIDGAEMSLLAGLLGVQ